MKVVFTALKRLLNILNNSLAVTIQEKDHFRCELNASQVQLQTSNAASEANANQATDLLKQLEQKLALTDILASALANVKSSLRSTPDRLSKDPEKFNGEEKDMLKR